MVIVVSVEGIKSNSEVNFYNHMNYHFQPKNVVYAHAIGKLSRKATNSKLISHKLRLNKLDESLNYRDNDVFYVYFLGDGDVSEAIDSMKYSMELAINYYKEVEKFSDAKFILHDHLIYDDKEVFESIFSKISGLSINELKEYKRENSDIFNAIANSSNWFLEGNLGVDRAVSSLDGVSNHFIIFSKIKELLKK